MCRSAPCSPASVWFLAQTVEVKERGAVRLEEEFHRKARISCQAINVHNALWPRLHQARPALLYCYISHRFLKWMTPFDLLFFGLFGLAGLWLVFGGIAPLLAVGLLAALLFGVWVNAPGAGMIVAGAVALSGVGYGVLEAVIARRTYATWTPAATVRD